MTTFSNDVVWLGLLWQYSDKKPKEAVFHREENRFPSHIAFT